MLYDPEDSRKEDEPRYFNIDRVDCENDRCQSVLDDRVNTLCICKRGEGAVKDPLQGEQILLESEFGRSSSRADFARPWY